MKGSCQALKPGTHLFIIGARVKFKLNMGDYFQFLLIFQKLPYNFSFKATSNIFDSICNFHLNIFLFMHIFHVEQNIKYYPPTSNEKTECSFRGEHNFFSWIKAEIN